MGRGERYWPAQATTSLTLDGVPYHFYNNGGELMFFRDAQAASGSVDILAAFQWLVSQGLVKSTDVPTQLEYGVEISSTSGTETFPPTGLTFSLSLRARGALPVQAGEGRGLSGGFTRTFLVDIFPAILGFVSIVSHEADDRWRRPVDSRIAGDELRDDSGTRSGKKSEAHYVVDDNNEPATKAATATTLPQTTTPTTTLRRPTTTTTPRRIATTTTIPRRPTTITTTTTTAPSVASCTNPSFSRSDAEGSDNTDPNDGHQYWWVSNDAWTGSHGPQSIDVCNQSSWYATSNQPNEGGQVETYPDTEYDVGGRNSPSTTPISGGAPSPPRSPRPTPRPAAGMRRTTSG